jgi:chorismate mutase
MSTHPERPPRETLAALRAEIERMDRALVDLVAARVRVAREAGEVKRGAGLPVLDPAREAAVVRRAGTMARDAGLDAEDVRGVFWQVIELSRRAQTAAAAHAGEDARLAHAPARGDLDDAPADAPRKRS